MSSGTFRTAASDESPRPILDHQVKSMLDQGNTFSPQNDQPGSQVEANDVDVQAQALVGLISQMMSSMNQEANTSCQNQSDSTTCED